MNKNSAEQENDVRSQSANIEGSGETAQAGTNSLWAKLKNILGTGQ